MHVLATAGHVDHGKSTLVRCLTGIDPDRLAEEKRRGLTIDIGFAWAQLPSGRTLVFVDVPGHARYIKNMLTGVGSVDGCLFVVAADDGWMPQSEEHLRILGCLGYAHGIVALTKWATVEPRIGEARRVEVRRHLEGTFLAHSEIVDTDAVTGHGLDRLRTALDTLTLDRTPPPDMGRPRLWIDRAFTVSGSGTVVTGTLTGGSISVGDGLTLVPDDIQVRVRRLQMLNQRHDVAPPGSRVAVNLTGASRADITRGSALVRGDQWRPCHTVDASLAVLGSLDHDVTRRGSYVAHIGSTGHSVAVRLLEANALRPGDKGLARLHLPIALPLVIGDRFVLRDDGRRETIGGGEILDIDPVAPAASARPTGAVSQIIAERGSIDVDDLEAMTGKRLEPTVGRWVIAPETLAATKTSIATAISAAGPIGLDVASLDPLRRAVLGDMDDVRIELGRARAHAEHDELADHPYVTAVGANPFNPPPPEGIDRAELRQLVRQRRLVERDGIFFSPDAVDRARRLVAAALRDEPEGLTVAQARDVLRTTRKFALALLALLDAEGVTRRRGDRRIAGPRLDRRLQ